CSGVRSKFTPTIVARSAQRLKSFGHLVFDSRLAGPNLDGPAGAGKPVVQVKPLSVLIDLGDPQKNLIEALASRPLKHGLDEGTPDALAAKTGIDPERGQRGGAVELARAGPHRADHLAVDLRHESGPFGEAAPPALLTRHDLGLVG